MELSSGLTVLTPINPFQSPSYERGIEMKRDDAERLFVEKVMREGNPEYFVWKYLRQMTDDDLEYDLSELIGDEVKIEDGE